MTYLFVELVDDPLCPLQVQVLTLQWSIHISQLDAHLAHQQSIVLVGPVDAREAFIAHLGGARMCKTKKEKIGSFSPQNITQENRLRYQMKLRQRDDGWIDLNSVPLH